MTESLGLLLLLQPRCRSWQCWLQLQLLLPLELKEGDSGLPLLLLMPSPRQAALQVMPRKA
jgi:hypothetical protein